MTIEALRSLILIKLADGRLPLNSIPRVWGGRGTAKPATPAKASSRSTSSSWKGSHWPAAKRRCSSTSGVSGSGNRNDGRSWRPGDRLHVGDKIILAT